MLCATIQASAWRSASCRNRARAGQPTDDEPVGKCRTGAHDRGHIWISPPRTVTLDDDTCDVVHGYQSSRSGTGIMGALFPIHIYDTRPAAGGHAAAHRQDAFWKRARHIRRLVRHLRRNWPDTHITIRGDGHYGRPEVMAYCDGPARLRVRLPPMQRCAPIRHCWVADACAVKRAQRQSPVLRNYAETAMGKDLEVPASRRCTDRGQHVGHGHRYVVTSLTGPQPRTSTIRFTARAGRPRT
ncbi:transposase [Sphingobium yanoikuyae]|uniref:transposase n=1 Tax=Sphingobium yanoikuyae TaxID=13690 RepID=UPI003CC7C7A0